MYSENADAQTKPKRIDVAVSQRSRAENRLCVTIGIMRSLRGIPYDDENAISIATWPERLARYDQRPRTGVPFTSSRG